jgi:hypothetical protein
VTVQGTGATGTALALDKSIVLSNWYLRPAMKTLPASGDTWELLPDGTGPFPYYNTFFVAANIGGTNVDLAGINPFFQYSFALGYIKATPDNMSVTPYVVPYTPIIEGQNAIIGSIVRFSNTIYFKMEITIPDRFVSYTPAMPGSTFDIITMLLRK